MLHFEPFPKLQPISVAQPLSEVWDRLWFPFSFRLPFTGGKQLVHQNIAHFLHQIIEANYLTRSIAVHCQCNALHSDGQTSVWQLSYNQPQPNYRHSDSSDPDNQLLTPQPTHFLIRTQILISIKSFQITLSSEITLLVSFKPLLPVFFLGCRQRWCRCSANKVCPVCLQLMSSVEWKLRDPGWLLWQVWCDMCYAIWSLIAWNRQRCPCCLASSRQEHYGIKSPWRSSPVNCQAANHGLFLRNSNSFFLLAKQRYTASVATTHE